MQIGPRGKAFGSVLPAAAQARVRRRGSMNGGSRFPGRVGSLRLSACGSGGQSPSRAIGYPPSISFRPNSPPRVFSPRKGKNAAETLTPRFINDIITRNAARKHGRPEAPLTARPARRPPRGSGRIDGVCPRLVRQSAGRLRFRAVFPSATLRDAESF